MMQKPRLICIDIRLAVQVWWQLGKILDVTTTIRLFECLCRSFPHSQYDEDVWWILEKTVDFDQMTAAQLENLEFSIQDTCVILDRILHQYLFPYEDDYAYHQMLEPWTVVMRLKDENGNH